MAHEMTNDSTASIPPAPQLRPGESPPSTSPASDAVGNGAAPGNRGRLRVVIALFLLGGLFAAFKFLPVTETMREFLVWVKGMGAWGPLLLGVAYVAACVLLVPGSVLTLGAGALFGLPLGIVTVVIASNLGAALSFLIGRTVARGWVEGKVAGNSKFQAIDDAVGKQGFKIVFLTRLSPVFPFNLQNYAYGVTKVSLRSYVLASLTGMLPGTVMYVYLGSAVRDLGAIFAGNIGGGPAMRIVGLIATIVVTVWVTKIAKRALSQDVPGSAGEAAGGAS